LASAIALSARDNLDLEASGWPRRFGLLGQDPGERVQLSNDLLLQPRTLSGPFLRIPPFPGRKLNGFAEAPDAECCAEAGDLLALVRKYRVGGTYWAARPSLPEDYALVRSQIALGSGALGKIGSAIVLWTSRPSPAAAGATAIEGDCDPWHMLSGAKALFAEEGDELCLIAAILDVPTYVKDQASAEFRRVKQDASLMLGRALADASFMNPFTGERMSPREAVGLCGFWRSLIDSNRDIAAALGFAFWKRDNVAPLLWGGSEPVCFDGDGGAHDGRSVAIWRSRASDEAIASLASSGTPLVEVEDGFLRSQGLGADCVPPLSITVDRLGAYFDPSRPSELESLLENGEFGEELLARARTLRSVIVEAGLGKYELGGAKLDRPAGARRHILVPGQVEDDRSVLAGGCGLVSNLDLLKRVREQASDAYILYKPHPDVLAGHRKGSMSGRTGLEFADQIVVDTPISSLIEMVDEVHVNTSLAGFEALLRKKPVTTYGVPFYAGWGLTCDKGPVPARRSATRTIDELVAAALLIYPRYLDPVTGVPCPAEIVVSRLVDGATTPDGLVVSMRRLQGKVMRRIRELAR
jgi:capsular polysaccharide export protein